jgi:hypothetical protein
MRVLLPAGTGVDASTNDGADASTNDGADASTNDGADPGSAADPVSAMLI